MVVSPDSSLARCNAVPCSSCVTFVFVVCVCVTEKSVCAGSGFEAVDCTLLDSLGGTCKCAGSVCVTVVDLGASPPDELIMGSDL